MYTIPTAFDINKLKGKKVQQICFSINTITISFGINNFINIEAGFSIVNKNNKSIDTGELYPISYDFSLLDLLEKSIMAVETNEVRDSLILIFDEGTIIKLSGHSQYESFSIKIGDEKIII